MADEKALLNSLERALGQNKCPVSSAVWQTPARIAMGFESVNALPIDRKL